MRAGTAVVLALLAGCVTTAPSRPEIDVALDPDTRGAACGVEPELTLGAVPEGALELARVQLSSSRPRSLARYQQALRRLARERCAHGVSLRSAEEEGGGVVRAEAVLWSRPELVATP